MCEEGFSNTSETEAWDFLEELAKKTLQWETTRNESLGARINSQKGGVHAVANTTYIDTRFADLKVFCAGPNPKPLSPSTNDFMLSMSIH